ncbi:tetratricopeptide repeat protein [Streptomyces sp. NPDC126497]|uniref:tetratricopeptide repeat protein n=1 Tax=Streptomyces sp. NPDC126497 TaxID=3155313 RepID=UPI003316B4CD
MSHPHVPKETPDDGRPPSSHRRTGGAAPPPAPSSASAGGEGSRVFITAASSGFGRTYVAAGDMTVHDAPAPYRLTTWSAEPPAVPPGHARARPGLLLGPGHAVVPFTGRGTELESLRRWRDDDSGPGPAVRLVHGPGGQGKSRLAAQAARLWSADGWSVLAARHRRDLSASAVGAEPVAGARGTLVVVDYAERWDLPDLVTLLKDLHVPGVLVRVLLLSRSAGQWWEVLRYRIDRDLGVLADARELGPLAPHPVHRAHLFEAARAGFAERLGVPDPEAVPPPAALLRHEEYGLVLSVHMAALTAVLAHLDGTAAPTEPAEVSSFLLARERDHWQELHRGLDRLFPTGPDTMARAVYTATLTGPLSHRAGLRALRKIGVHSAAPDQVLTDHGLCYPPTVIGTVLEPLRPDRLGEDFLALSTPGHTSAYPADPWADEAVAELLSGTPQDSALAWVPPALTTLIETARRWPHMAERLCRVLRAHPWLAVRGGNGVLIALAGLDFLDSALLEAIGAHLPVGPSLELDVGVAAFAQRLTEDRLARTDDAATRARLRTELGARLSSADLHRQAVVEYREALAIHRRLDPADYSLDQAEGLSIALGGLGNSQAALGRYEEALTNTTSAVEAYRALASALPATHGPVLARVLVNQGGQLWEVGRRQEAVKATEEAVEVCRPRDDELVTHEAEAARGAALGNLGMMLLQTGEPERALAATAESVAIHRRLVETDPASHRPGLAESLHRYAAVREALRADTDHAAGAAAEATELYTDLAGVRRDRFAEALHSSRRLEEQLDDTSAPAELRRAALRHGVRHISVPPRGRTRPGGRPPGPSGGPVPHRGTVPGGP